MAGSWSGSPATWTPGQIVTDTLLNTELRERMLWLGGTAGSIIPVATVSTLAGASTASASFVNIALMTLTQTTTGGPVLLMFSASCQNSSVTTNDFGFAVDGVSQGLNGRFTSSNTNVDYLVNLSLSAPAVSAASHVFTMQWRTAAGTLAADAAAQMYFSVYEFRR